MTLMICPGIHDPGLSDRFCEILQKQLRIAAAGVLTAAKQPLAVLPTQRYAPFNGWAVWSYWQEVANPAQPLMLIAFSAGVVGAIAAAQLWHTQGRKIEAVIAIDGWGVPQIGDFPLYRVSHDHFTHWSSALLGAGQDSFYADPPVTHLELWQHPELVAGIWVPSGNAPSTTSMRMTAIEFIVTLLLRHGCSYDLEFLIR